MANKHNKLRNTGLLFELLVRQFTTDTLTKKEDSSSVAILKEYFNNTDIFKEYQIYNTIAKAKNLSDSKAEVLLSACLESYKKLPKDRLKNQKYKLIAEIKKSYDLDEFFKAKVDNYTVLASVYNLLEMHASPSIDIDNYSKCKSTILEHITSKKESQDNSLIEEFSKSDEGTRALIYKMTVNKFNERYEGLDNSQKSLLKEYINNISTSNHLKEYCNKEINTIKTELKSYIKAIPDEVRKIKLQEVSNLISEIPSSRNVNESDISNILSYLELLKECKSLK